MNENLRRIMGLTERIIGVVRTSDGFYLGMLAGDIGYNAFMGKPDPNARAIQRNRDLWGRLSLYDRKAIIREARRSAIDLRVFYGPRVKAPKGRACECTRGAAEWCHAPGAGCPSRDAGLWRDREGDTFRLCHVCANRAFMADEIEPACETCGGSGETHGENGVYGGSCHACEGTGDREI